MKKVFVAILLSVAFQLAVSGLADAQSSVVPKGPIKTFEAKLLAVGKRDTGAALPPRHLGDKIELIKWKGKDAIRRESTVMDAANTRIINWEITVSDAKTILPLYGEWRRADGTFVKREYDGLHVKQSCSAQSPFGPRVMPGTHIDTINTSYDLPGQAYDWLGGAGLPIVLGLPLRDGLEGTLPIISGDKDKQTACVTGECTINMLAYHVSGPETITGLSGKPTSCWKVSEPARGFTFYVTVKDPHLEQVTWPGGGPTAGVLFHMERGD